MADLPRSRLKVFTPPFHFTACDYFDPYKHQQKQDRKVLWGHFYVPKHESSTPGAGCRLLYNEIYADIVKIFCHKAPTGNDAEQQWFAVSWCGVVLRQTMNDLKNSSLVVTNRKPQQHTLCSKLIE